MRRNQQPNNQRSHPRQKEGTCRSQGRWKRMRKNNQRVVRSVERHHEHEALGESVNPTKHKTGQQEARVKPGMPWHRGKVLCRKPNTGEKDAQQGAKPLGQ